MDRERMKERERERVEREARWDLRRQRYRLGLKMGHSALCSVLLGKLISDLDFWDLYMQIRVSHVKCTNS